MSIREVVTIPHPVLRRKARKVDVYDEEFQSLIDDMIDTMRDEPGVGLAAPQVNVSSRVVTVEWGSDDDEEAPKKLYAVVNPEIIKRSSETVLGIEGCLSIPNLVGEVERHVEIVVKGFNRYGQPLKIKARGWAARIFQHEIDHLDGILFPDRATEVWIPEANEEEAVS